MRLGFHYHIPAEQRDGVIYMPGYQGRFVDCLTQYCDHVICFLHSPRASEQKFLDYGLTAPNIELINLGPRESVPRRVLFSKRQTDPVIEQRAAMDAVLLRGPSPLLPAVAKAAGSLPIILLLVGDHLTGIADLEQPRWRKEAIRLWATWNKHQQTQIAKHSLVFVNSRQVYDELRTVIPNLFETHTTTLNASDFFDREDTCGSRPYHLLYAGRLDRAKGLFEIAEALALLVAQGEDVVLDLVGWPLEDDHVLEELESFARAKGVADRVKYHGYKAVGPELFSYYRKADIFVIASKSCEGFPRAIWEAMASSLPVVATRVGSIPHFINGAAQLVEPGGAVALAAALRRVINDPALRQQMIQSGSKLAHDITLEKQISRMVTQIEAWIR